MCVWGPSSKPQLCSKDGQGRDGGGARCPLFTWPVGRSPKTLSLPSVLCEGREKGAQSMIVTHGLCAPGRSSSSVVVSRHPAGLAPCVTLWALSVLRHDLSSRSCCVCALVLGKEETKSMTWGLRSHSWQVVVVVSPLHSIWLLVTKCECGVFRCILLPFTESK